ncbi:MAG TPA: hypothetical protein VK563_07905 [Puia sp.]|nr:hypothetical protein [Puia sp.]
MAMKEKKADQTTMDLPEVKDIPGQEHIRPIPLTGLSDTTASSDGEEGKGILDDPDDLGLVMGTEADVTPEERALLKNVGGLETGTDDDSIRDAALDQTDEDGDPLNESSLDKDLAGGDLDVPGAEDDDADEALGEEDEENNEYSLGDNE